MPRKKLTDMTADELAEATREFDGEFAFLKTRPLTDQDRRRHAAARRRGRPAIGQGAEKIRVSIERGLLARSDAFARKHKLSRSELIARGLQAMLAGKDTASTQSPVKGRRRS